MDTKVPKNKINKESKMCNAMMYTMTMIISTKYELSLHKENTLILISGFNFELSGL